MLKDNVGVDVSLCTELGNVLCGVGHYLLTWTMYVYHAYRTASFRLFLAASY